MLIFLIDFQAEKNIRKISLFKIFSLKEKSLNSFRVAYYSRSDLSLEGRSKKFPRAYRSFPVKGGPY